MGVLAALCRLTHIRPLQWVATTYVDFFRTTPLLVQLVWIYFALPMLIGTSLPGVSAGAIGLSLFIGSYLAETIRAGILSIDRGQSEAAMALGMSYSQVMRRVVLPQAVVRMLPAIASTFMTLVKDSSLCSVVSVPELMRQGDALASYTLFRMETMTVVAFMYFFLTYPLSVLVNFLHRRFSIESVEARRPTEEVTLEEGGKRAVPVEI